MMQMRLLVVLGPTPTPTGTFTWSVVAQIDWVWLLLFLATVVLCAATIEKTYQHLRRRRRPARSLFILLAVSLAGLVTVLLVLPHPQWRGLLALAMAGCVGLVLALRKIVRSDA